MEGDYERKTNVLNKLMARNKININFFLGMMLKFENFWKLNYQRKSVLLYFFLKCGALPGITEKRHAIMNNRVFGLITQINPYLLPKIISYIPVPNNYIRHYYIKN